jgi:hypothetical protein
MNPEMQSKEKRILVIMRKVLSNIVKETTPAPGLKHPLSDQTIQDIRKCFQLISVRERELANEAGLEIKDRPRFTDEPQTTKTVSIKKKRTLKLDQKPE